MADRFCPKCVKKIPGELENCPECGVRLIASMDGDLSGSVLDERYDVIESLGKGGMGVVYKARQRIIDRWVALKVLRRELVQDESSVKRFLVEAKAVASLRSPHTITLYDFGISREGLLYFTMELLEGRALTKIIRTEAPLDPERAVGLVLQVCDSLKEAHGKGILHRDLKPDNIYVLPGEGGKEHVKVLDFGIAKMLNEGKEGSITATGMICGTPMYLSPEQATGLSLDGRSDMYSLGIILYEMLAGSPPFEDATPMGILLKQVNQEPAPVSVRNPNVQVPLAIDRFIMRVLSKRPEDRPDTIDAFARQLRSALDSTRTDFRQVRISSVGETAEGVVVPLPDKPKPGRGQAAGEPDEKTTSVPGRRQMADSGATPPVQKAGKAGKRLLLWLAAASAVLVGCVVILLLITSNTPQATAPAGSLSTPQATAPADGGGQGSNSASLRAAGDGKTAEAKGAEEAKAKAEEEAKAKAEAEAKQKAEAEAKQKAEAEAKQKAEAEAKQKAEAEAKQKAEAEARAKAEAEAKQKAEAEALLKIQTEQEAKAKQQGGGPKQGKAVTQGKSRSDIEKAIQKEVEKETGKELQGLEIDLEGKDGKVPATGEKKTGKEPAKEPEFETEI
jgi:serine/threonine protein kinase